MYFKNKQISVSPLATIGIFQSELRNHSSQLQGRFCLRSAPARCEVQAAPGACRHGYVGWYTRNNFTGAVHGNVNSRKVSRNVLCVCGLSSWRSDDYTKTNWILYAFLPQCHSMRWVTGNKILLFFFFLPWKSLVRAQYFGICKFWICLKPWCPPVLP